MPADAYLLDTSVASIAFDADHRHCETVRARLAGLDTGSTLWVSSISLGEIEYGLQVSPTIPVVRHAGIRATFAQYQIYTVDRHTARCYGELRGELFRRYASREARGRIKQKRPEDILDPTTSKELGVQENDIWILAVAIEYNLNLITRDRMTKLMEVAADIHSYTRCSVWTLP